MKMEEAKHEEKEEKKKLTGKVPIIRLKLKVQEQMVLSEKDEVATGHKDEIISSPATRDVCISSFHGTCQYKPFKLYPLLPPGSHYRVLIPSKYTHLTNPAIKLNYIWTERDADVFTDDSDLVCCLIAAGKDDFWGKRVLVEVQVVNHGVNIDSNIDASSVHASTIDASNIDADSNIDTSTADADASIVGSNTTSYPVVKSRARAHAHPRVQARSIPASSHDGHYIKIVKYIVNPSSVHLKRWRKRTRPFSLIDPIYTPEFKPGHLEVDAECETSQGATKETATKSQQDPKAQFK